MFLSSGEGRQTSTLLSLLERVVQLLRLTLSKVPNNVGVFLLSPENGNRSSFRNVMFSSYLEFRALDKVQKPSDSEVHRGLSKSLEENAGIVPKNWTIMASFHII
jgi:hypothetical protein